MVRGAAIDKECRKATRKHKRSFADILPTADRGSRRWDNDTYVGVVSDHLRCCGKSPADLQIDLFTAVLSDLRGVTKDRDIDSRYFQKCDERDVGARIANFRFEYAASLTTA